MKRGVLSACLLAAMLVTGAARADCGNGRPLTGVNLAGAEFKPRILPGVLNKDYTYPRASDLSYYAGKGATAIRLPVRWERVQPALMEELDPGQAAAISEVLVRAGELGLCIILDVHNYGTYRDQPIGSDAVPEAAFIDLWQRLAQRFPEPSRVALDLMNEPKGLPIARWASLAQHTVTALRQAGSQHLILVAGGRWSGVHEWFKPFAGVSNAQAFAGFTDPLRRTVLQAHQYADFDYSGTHHASCLPAESFDKMFRALSEWAVSNHQRLFLGEFGVSGSPDCLAALERMLNLTADRQVWIGWTYWAGGHWWGNYPMSIAPRGDGSDAPQMSVVSRYLGK